MTRTQAGSGGEGGGARQFLEDLIGVKERYALEAVGYTPLSNVPGYIMVT
jgi:hypothetical protein